MVSSTSILMMAVTLILSILAPILFLIILLRGRKGVFTAWIAGALGFYVPQMLIRLPLLQLAGTQVWFADFARQSPAVLALLLAFTAGLFETAGRWVVLRFGLSKRLSFMTGLSAGAGHGAAESIILIGLTYVNNLIISLAINAGTLSSMITDPAVSQPIVAALTGTSPDLFLAAGLERLFTMAFHAAMTVLFCLFIVRRRTLAGFALVLILHSAVDFGAVFMQQQGTAVWVIEAILAVVAALSIALIIWLRPRFADNQEIPPDPGEEAVQQGY